jgi:regulator of protease activity HflC (stomatin/prohibitin superfamily)
MEPKRKAAANVFLEQNLNQADDEDGVLPAIPAPPPGVARSERERLASPYVPRSPIAQTGLKTSEELQLEKEPIRVRETGFWPFKRVIVPPNVYVVHTRIGRAQPVTLGLGLSFRYNAATDAYLVVPAAMQTIGIVANSITREKQGINVLAYVQWQINDFGVAYRKLDFSDSRDPLGIVNAQLREQAEAAIKDKIATLSVEDVLTDKEPVIEELTTRLKAVAEGRNAASGGSDEGLGIKIVTVQIKEAVVSSQRLWEHLQAPFRYEQEKAARISYLETQDEIRQKELLTRQATETSEAETLVEIERIKQSKQTEALEIRVVQERTRFTREQEVLRERVQTEEQTTLIREASDQRVQSERARIEQEVRLAALRRQQEEAIEQTRLDAEASARQKQVQVEQTLREFTEEARLAEAQLQTRREQVARDTALQQLQAAYTLLVQSNEIEQQRRAQAADLAVKREAQLARLELEEATNRVYFAKQQSEADIARLQQEVRNLANERDIAARLIAQLPDLAAHMPEIHELKVLQSGNGDGAFDALPSFLARMLAVAESMGVRLLPERADEQN